MSRRRDKKTTHLEVRISPATKDAFMRECERNGTTASDAVRTFVDAYLARSRSEKLKQIVKDITMKLIKNPVKATLSASGVGAGIVAASLLFAAPAVSEATLRPLNLPSPVYPADMMAEGLSARCNVTFSVTEAGVVEGDIQANCTHPGFTESAVTAVSAIRFDVTGEDGTAKRVENVVYPLVYELRSNHEGATETVDIHGPE